MMPILRIALTVGLLEGTTWRQSLINLRKPAEKLVDTGVKLPLTIFMESMCKLGASKGGRSAAISYSMTPIDQTSVLKVYGCDCTISGER